MFDSFLHAPWMLLGLAVLAIPVLIHLLNRRRFDTVEWGAMQFLQVSQATRRRLMLEEVLLMALRMALLAVLVLALAGPFTQVSSSARLFASRPSRDIVLVIDGSASMSASDATSGPSPFALAKEQAAALLDDLGPGDSLALLLAREQPIALVGDLSQDRARLRAALDDLPEPAGSCDWSSAVRSAYAILQKGQKAEREVVLLTDNQKFGWADPDALFRWELLSGELGLNRSASAGPGPRPKLWCVDLSASRSGRPPNYALGPLRAGWPVLPVDREVTFRCELLLYGHQRYQKPYRIRLLVDGKPVKDLPAPPGTGEAFRSAFGRIPFSFTHRFNSPGSHLVTVELQADPPPAQRPQGYQVRDWVPGDNRQDFAVEVLTALPVLLVDGDTSAATPPRLGADFLRDALAQKGDPAPSVRPRVVGVNQFTPEMLTAEPRPRVVILHDVPRLTLPQQEAVGTFIAEGGGVLVTLGDRADARFYNEQLYRGGEGWLPGRLEGIEGEEGRPEGVVRPDPTTFTHPALALFAKFTQGGLGDARFPRFWRLETPGQHSGAGLVGMLQGTSVRSRVPFLIERGYRAGRALLSAVPLDGRWGTNLVEDVPAFVPLAHELVYYLAGARSADFNLRAGQPIRYRLAEAEPLGEFRLRPPVGPEQPLSDQADPGTYRAEMLSQPKGAVLVFDGAREAGVYRLKTPQGRAVWYVVPPDPREADLTPATPAERERVVKLTGAKEVAALADLFSEWATGSARVEWWWYLLLGLIGLLCVEVWMTRRLVMNR